jgi:hypothetical protein
MIYDATHGSAQISPEPRLEKRQEKSGLSLMWLINKDF